jgi:DNA-binding transcriptional LysR family regulator
MNLRQLEHLIAVAETGSFSRAAERLHLTQSALSRSIQMLEVELGARLIDRMGRLNELTPIGEAVAARARGLLDEVEDLRLNVSLLRSGNAGPIRVGLGSGPGVLLMTPFLIHMAQKHPDMRVTLTRGSSELQLVQLRERVLDALVIDVGSLAPAPDLTIEDAVSMRAGFVCRAGHPLRATGPRRVSFHEMLRYPLASSPLSDETATILVRHFGPSASPQSTISLRCEEVASLLEVVKHSDAIFLGVVAAAQSGIASGELVELETDPPLEASAHYAIVKLSGRTENPSMAIFRSFLADRLRNETLPRQQAFE